MDIINSLLVATQTGFWANIITSFESFIFDYAWAIILLTVIIKLILSPFDFLNKKVSRDNAKMQAVIAPQMQKLQKQYANDRAKLNQKTTELYKSNNFNIMGSCLSMLGYLVVTLIIFISLFTALNAMSAYKIEEQYLELKQTYEITTGTTEEKQQAVLLKYDEIKNDFIWVQNVWVADNFWTHAILSFDNYITAIGDNVKTDINAENTSYKSMLQTDKEEFEATYNNVMEILFEQRNQPNGYLITAVFAVVSSFFAQYLMQKRLGSKNKNQNDSTANTQASTNKVLLVILPIVMGVFTLFYNAVFGLYIVAGQLVSLITFPIIDKLLDKYYAKKDREKDEKTKLDYSRRR
ncbi:MAG: YidC/Oxa1 family membrane protein insertase [Clostridia bacterium]|nr:YidC/Oxa1 family membrane protein insertase [Clostridia bacterium]